MPKGSHPEKVLDKRAKPTGKGGQTAEQRRYAPKRELNKSPAGSWLTSFKRQGSCLSRRKSCDCTFGLIYRLELMSSHKNE